MRRWLLVVAVPLVAISLVCGAAAEPPPAPAAQAEDANLQKARELFTRGAQLARAAQWAEALAAYESSFALRRHPVTLYNIARCYSAIGSYTLARDTFVRALAMSDATQDGGDKLALGLADDARGRVAEISGLLARARITLVPAEASIAVDGRPLEAAGATEGRPTLVAGVRPPGRGEAAPAGTFDVLLNPGPHVFTLSRKGFGDAVVNRTFPPSSVTPLRLELDRLPATLHVSSNVDGAIVTVDGADVGPVPVDVLRPGGSYQLVVKKKGFVTYESRVVVEPGEQTNLRASLREEKKSLAERWWFWSAIGTAVAGGVVATYFATRPAPQRPACDGGATGWCVQVR